jgi:hypothetical protein
VAARGKSVDRKASGRNESHDRGRADQAPFSSAHTISGRGDGGGMHGSSHKREKAPDELRRSGIAVNPKKPPGFDFESRVTRCAICVVGCKEVWSTAFGDMSGALLQPPHQ